jgi:hypothetical protein
MNILLMFSIVFYTSLSVAEESWQLAQDEDDIRVYTKPNAKTMLKDFKADMIVQASIEKVNSHMSAMEDQTKWMYDRKLTKVLDRPNDRSSIIYSVTNAPWPVMDRDAVVSFTYNENNTDEFIRIDVVNVDDYHPLDKDMVRVPYLKGFWELIKIDDNSTKIVFMNAASPGGDIPDWLADSFVLDMPYHSLNNFRDMLKNINKE